jgi:hypothetical protein
VKWVQEDDESTLAPSAAIGLPNQPPSVLHPCNYLSFNNKYQWAVIEYRKFTAKDSRNNAELS